MEFLTQLNWLAVGQITLIDILLGGDNAIVIALACRNLPQHLRMKGILWGTTLAIFIRIALITFAVTLLQVPFIKIVGGLLLLWVGVKLYVERDQNHDDVPASDRLFNAVKTILIADLVMSVDNVIGVSSAAELAGGEHRFALIVFGILASVPIIVWGSTLVLKLMQRFPLIITGGAALLGYLAGGMIATDVAIVAWLQNHAPYLDWHLPAVDLTISIPSLLGAALVILIGVWRIDKNHNQAIQT